MKSDRGTRGRAAVAAALAICAGAAFAQMNVMKPGLWEMRMASPQMDAARAQMKAQMEKMPADQRAQMEKMLSQSGAAMTGDGAIRICHTAQTLQRDGLAKPEPGCEVKHGTRGAVSVFDMTCKNGRSGHGEFTVTPDTIKGVYEGTDPARSGKMRVEQSGRWLGADCGSIKPLAMPAGKG